MVSDAVHPREEQARDATGRVLRSADRQAGEAAMQELPLSPGDAVLLNMALGLERRDTRAMMLGKAASGMAEFGDAATGVGIARALEEFWVGEGQTDDRYQPLARVELGSVLVTQARGHARIGQADRAKAVCLRHPTLHDQQGYLGIIAAEALARADRFDEARAMLPCQRPRSNVAEETAWDVVDRLLKPYEPDEDAAAGAVGLEERWHQAIDAAAQVIAATGKMAGLPEMIMTVMQSRLDEERARVPQGEAELVRRVEGLRGALQGALSK